MPSISIGAINASKLFTPTNGYASRHEGDVGLAGLHRVQRIRLGRCGRLLECRFSRQLNRSAGDFGQLVQEWLRLLAARVGHLQVDRRRGHRPAGLVHAADLPAAASDKQQRR
jgi:hypothetical protein